jgi:hypothetical protein
MSKNVLPPMYLQVKNFLMEKIEGNVYKGKRNFHQKEN